MLNLDDTIGLDSETGRFEVRKKLPRSVLLDFAVVRMPVAKEDERVSARGQ